MFYQCESLTTAPYLPATKLSSGCYYDIFCFCSALNSIKIEYIGDYDSTYYGAWVWGVASSGVFFYNGGETARDFQLPSGWKTKSF